MGTDTIYSYGNQRFALGKPLTAFWLFFLIILPQMAHHNGMDLSRMVGDRYPLIMSLLYMAAFLILMIRFFQFCFPRKRPDLPSAIEITDASSLRLFHGQEVYGEVQISEIASLKDEMLDVLPWSNINATRLALKTPVQGVNHIYVLPYLKGYSDFIYRLSDLSPTLRSVYNGSEWESTMSGSLALALGMLLFFVVLVLVCSIAFIVQPHVRGHASASVLWVVWGLEAAFIAALWETAREARKRVTIISFYPDKMQIVRSSIWYSDVRPEEITGVEVVPSGTHPERCAIETEKGSFLIYSEYMKNYPDLLKRIKRFSESLQD